MPALTHDERVAKLCEDIATAWDETYPDRDVPPEKTFEDELNRLIRTAFPPRETVAWLIEWERREGDGPWEPMREAYASKGKADERCLVLGDHPWDINVTVTELCEKE